MVEETFANSRLLPKSQKFILAKNHELDHSRKFIPMKISQRPFVKKNLFMFISLNNVAKHVEKFIFTKIFAKLLLSLAKEDDLTRHNKLQQVILEKLLSK